MQAHPAAAAANPRGSAPTTLDGRRSAGLLRLKVAARQGGGTSVRRIAGFGRLFGRANSGSRELPRDFRGICVRPFLMPNSRKPHNQRLSPQYPQRDSNPCRHLEREPRRERSERQRAERPRCWGSADWADVSGSGDSGRPRDFRGIGLGATPFLRSRHCHAASRCLATAELPVRRRRVDTPTRIGRPCQADRHSVADSARRRRPQSSPRATADSGWEKPEMSAPQVAEQDVVDCRRRHRRQPARQGPLK